ncbi:hypothetical protein [Sediminicurvatus halobius]|uniref:hypothetical protein n=1 Tax=Sediminicurvatus halobius TaxID=2182432 RepID=UPI0011B286D0|nr:hypothetical protein [Spiribacter halobius]UEX77721.1 hypothetical protein LMH63_17595 [Spiribacter halobius]
MAKRQLNKYLLDDIYSVLLNSEFGIDAFDITFPDKGKVLLRVVFRPEKQYEIMIEDIGGLPHRVASTEKPGEHLSEEIYGDLGFGQIPDRMYHWIENLAGEIRASGARPDGIGELAEQLEEFISEHIEEPNEKFSDQEISDLVERLERLEQRFSELEESGLFTAAQKANIATKIEEAAEDLPHLRKGVWYHVALNKILTAVKAALSSKEAREIMKEAAKKLVGLG